jgi:preprotein translocase subunit SecA
MAQLLSSLHHIKYNMLNFISKLFGNKSERDVKSILPLVEKVKTEFAKLGGITNDDLRSRTDAFKETISAGLAGIDSEIQAIKDQTENNPDMEVSAKVELYTQLDKLEKDRNKELEVILMTILPEAFAVVKETAKRFKENKTIEVTATQFDRDLAARKSNVLIKGDKAIHHNTWFITMYSLSVVSFCTRVKYRKWQRAKVKRW